MSSRWIVNFASWVNAGACQIIRRARSRIGIFIGGLRNLGFQSSDAFGSAVDQAINVEVYIASNLDEQVGQAGVVKPCNAGELMLTMLEKRRSPLAGSGTKTRSHTINTSA